MLGVHVLDCLFQRVPESLRRRTKLTVIVECLESSFETCESSSSNVWDHRDVLTLPSSFDAATSLRFTIYKRSATTSTHERVAVGFSTTESSLWSLLAGGLRHDLILACVSTLDASHIVARLRVGLQLFNIEDEAKALEFSLKKPTISLHPSMLLPRNSAIETPPHVALTAAGDVILKAMQDLAVALDWHAPGPKDELLLPVLTFVEFVRARVSASAAHEIEAYLADKAVGAAPDIVLIFSSQGMTDGAGVYLSSAMVFIARRLKVATGATREAEEREMKALLESLTAEINGLGALHLECEGLVANKSRSRSKKNAAPSSSSASSAPAFSFPPEVQVEDEAKLVTCIPVGKYDLLCSKAVEAFSACISTRSLVLFERRLRTLLLSNDEQSGAWRTLKRLKAVLPRSQLMSGLEDVAPQGTTIKNIAPLAILVDEAAKAVEACAGPLKARCAEVLSLMRAAMESEPAATALTAAQPTAAAAQPTAAAAQPTAAAAQSTAAAAQSTAAAAQPTAAAAQSTAAAAQPTAAAAQPTAAAAQPTAAAAQPTAAAAQPTAAAAPTAFSAGQWLAAVAGADGHFFRAREAAPDLCMRWLGNRDLVVILGLLSPMFSSPTAGSESGNSDVLLEALAACSSEVADAPVLLFGAFALLDEGERSETSFFSFAHSLSELLGTGPIMGSGDEDKADAEISLLSHAYKLIGRCTRGMKTKVLPGDAEIATALDALPALESTLDIVNGRSLLHLAAESRAAPLVRVLLQRGKINPMRRDIYALTAPELARGDVDLLGLFLPVLPGEKRNQVLAKKRAK